MDSLSDRHECSRFVVKRCYIEYDPSFFEMPYCSVMLQSAHASSAVCVLRLESRGKILMQLALNELTV